MDNFTKKYGPWALIAGASEGIGAAFAWQLAAKGLNLLLLARRLEKLEALAANIKTKHNVDIRCIQVDLGNLAKIQALTDSFTEEIGLLIYNAAYSPIGPFATRSEEDLLKVADVNVKAPLVLAKRLSQKMIARNGGGIVFMSSLAGMQGSPKIATYAASKAFNVVLAEGLWSELKPHNIDVLACIAGAVRTPGYNSASQQKDAPGTLNADQVVAKTLKALGNGPTIVPGWINKIARFFMGHILTRKAGILIMNKNTKDLI